MMRTSHIRDPLLRESHNLKYGTAVLKRGARSEANPSRTHQAAANPQGVRVEARAGLRLRGLLIRANRVRPPPAGNGFGRAPHREVQAGEGVGIV